LKPGEISHVVETASGLHLIERYAFQGSPSSPRLLSGSPMLSTCHAMNAGTDYILRHTDLSDRTNKQKCDQVLGPLQSGSMFVPSLPSEHGLTTHVVRKHPFCFFPVQPIHHHDSIRTWVQLDDWLTSLHSRHKPRLLPSLPKSNDPSNPGLVARLLGLDLRLQNGIDTP